MEKFNKLNDFIEGNLNEKQESDLLYELSSNDELRMEFKNILNINSALRNNSSLFQVPIATEQSLFSTLGIAAVGSAAVSGSTIAYIPGFFALNSKLILTSISSAAAAALLIFSLLGVLGYEKKDSGNETSKTTQIIQTSEMSAKNNISINQNPEVTKSQIITKYVYIEKQSKNEDNLDNSENISDKDLDKIPPVDNINVDSNDLSQNLIPEPEKQDEPLDIDSNLIYMNNNLSKDNKNFEIEFKGSQYLMTEEPTISPSVIAPFNNSGLAAYYNLSDNIAIGVEIRQETFFQVYNGYDEYGQYTIYEQQPNFTSISAVFRYSLPYYGKFSPFSQITLGGNKVGALGRFMIGTKYKLYDDISFSLGLEYSNLFYNYQSGRFNASKFGLNYSIFYNL